MSPPYTAYAGPLSQRSGSLKEGREWVRRPLSEARQHVGVFKLVSNILTEMASRLSVMGLEVGTAMAEALRLLVLVVTAGRQAEPLRLALARLVATLKDMDNNTILW